jgi:hypothetical protein
MYEKHETLILFIEDLPSLQTPSDVREFRQSFNELRSAPYLCPNGGQLWLDMYDQFWTEGNFGNENATSHRSYFDAIPDYIALNPDIQDFIHFNQNKLVSAYLIQEFLLYASMMLHTVSRSCRMRDYIRL